MIIDCISDLHGHYPQLEGGDLLIVAGDLTAHDDYDEHQDFREWLQKQDYKQKIFIAGNHDNYLTKCYPYPTGITFPNGTYLCDSGTECEGLKIWGSPWTLRSPGMNPHCMAFTVDTEEELAEKWALIPNDVAILVTHSPPFQGKSYDEQVIETSGPGFVYHNLDRTIYGENVGSKNLNMKCDPDSGLRLHVFGHVHEGYGHYHEINPIFEIDLVNASYVNERYEPVNKPIRIEL